VGAAAATSTGSASIGRLRGEYKWAKMRSGKTPS